MNITDAKKVLKVAHLANDTVLMQGLHGIGKSQVVESFAEEEGFHIETLFLSMMEVGDLMGMPKTRETKHGAYTDWSEPDWFKNCVDAAWAPDFEIEDIVFHDKDFERYVMENV